MHFFLFMLYVFYSTGAHYKLKTIIESWWKWLSLEYNDEVYSDCYKDEKIHFLSSFFLVWMFWRYGTAPQILILYIDELQVWEKLMNVRALAIDDEYQENDFFWFITGEKQIYTHKYYLEHCILWHVLFIYLKKKKQF